MTRPAKRARPTPNPAKSGSHARVRGEAGDLSLLGLTNQERDERISRFAELIRAQKADPRQGNTSPTDRPKAGRPLGIASQIAAKTGLSLRTVQRVLKRQSDRMGYLRGALPDGARRPTRECPPDFRERFLEFGQSKELEEHYATNWRCIVRWIEECGGDALRAQRRKVTDATARPKLRARCRMSRYVLGRTLSGRASQ